MASNWAIVIGINDYQHHPERKLKYAVNDAQRIGDFLSQQASFGEAHVMRCLGDATHQGSLTYPTCSNLLRSLRQDLHPTRLGKVNHLWFYFSGHGVSRNGRDYLITADCLEDEIERFALPIDEVIATLQLHKDADIVLVLDACRQMLGRKGDFDNLIGEQTIAAAKECGITTIFSCGYGQSSYELDALQQGAFTYALVEGLAQHTLPIQLEKYLRQRVPELHQQYRRDRIEQSPRIRVEPVSKALQPLLPDAVTTADIEVLVDQAKADELEENFEIAKKLWWQVIDVSQSSAQRRDARIAIERIDRKIARLHGNRPPVDNPPQSAQPQIIITSPQARGRVAGDKQPHSLLPQSRGRVAGDRQFDSLLSPGDDLSSERFGGNYYTKLRDLLKTQAWKAADKETADCMCEVMDRQKEGCLRVGDIKQFPCQDLRNIDRLWVKYSHGLFGFSVQKKIYLECGGILEEKHPGDAIWDNFGDKVGWRIGKSWISYSDVTFYTSAPRGHLPAFFAPLPDGFIGVFIALLARRDL